MNIRPLPVSTLSRLHVGWDNRIVKHSQRTRTFYGYGRERKIGIYLPDQDESASETGDAANIGTRVFVLMHETLEDTVCKGRDKLQF